MGCSKKVRTTLNQSNEILQENRVDPPLITDSEDKEESDTASGDSPVASDQDDTEKEPGPVTPQEPDERPDPVVVTPPSPPSKDAVPLPEESPASALPVEPKEQVLSSENPFTSRFLGPQKLPFAQGKDVSQMLATTTRELTVPGGLQSGQFCLAESKPLDHPTRVLFIVDKSAHNWHSDHRVEKRRDSIRRFFETNKDNGWYSWGMITFQGDQARSEIFRKDSGSDPVFTKDLSLVDRAINSLTYDAYEGGDVGYQDALSLAKKAIRDDLRQFPREEADYKIFFITGARPTDYNNYNDLQEDVREIVNLEINKVSLSTVYYGLEREHRFGRHGQIGVKDILKTMAYVGRGGYTEIQGPGFEDQDDARFYALFQSMQTPEAWHLQDSKIVVHNLNATMCENGFIGVDSDSDFLCDEDEERYGFNPQNRFSFPAGHNTPDKIRRWSGYGDYFRQREIYHQQMLSACSLPSHLDTDHDFLTNCEESHITNTDPNMPLTNRTSSDPRLSDTDRDFFIDGLEFSYFKYRDGGRGGRFLLDQSNVQAIFDGEQTTAGDQMLQHRNPFQQDDMNFKYQVQATPHISALGPDGGTNCYQYQQSEIRLYPTKQVFIRDTLQGVSHRAGENVMLVYFFMTPRLNTAPWRGAYQYGLRRLVLPPRESHFAPGMSLENISFRAYSLFQDISQFLQ